MKIYTKTGDRGTTGLFGGKRVSKDAPRITAYGEIDELNAWLGVVRAETPHEPIASALAEVQHVLFLVGAQLATPQEDPRLEKVTAAHAEALERQMDVIDTALPKLTQFILPGGGRTAAWLHVARTVCRRAERAAVHLSTSAGEVIDPWVLIYINRLSDFLFVLARLANQLEKIQDVPWSGGLRR